MLDSLIVGPFEVRDLGYAINRLDQQDCRCPPAVRRDCGDAPALTAHSLAQYRAGLAMAKATAAATADRIDQLQGMTWSVSPARSVSNTRESSGGLSRSQSYRFIKRAWRLRSHERSRPGPIETVVSSQSAQAMRPLE